MLGAHGEGAIQMVPDTMWKERTPQRTIMILRLIDALAFSAGPNGDRENTIRRVIDLLAQSKQIEQARELLEGLLEEL